MFISKEIVHKQQKNLEKEQKSISRWFLTVAQSCGHVGDTIHQPHTHTPMNVYPQTDKCFPLKTALKHEQVEFFLELSVYGQDQHRDPTP